MLDPIMFPILMSVSFFSAATTDVANSGTLVPNAIIDTEIIRSSIPKFRANPEAPDTNQWAPKTKPILLTAIIAIAQYHCISTGGVISSTAQDSCLPVTAIRQVNISGTTRLMMRSQ